MRVGPTRESLSALIGTPSGPYYTDWYDSPQYWDPNVNMWYNETTRQVETGEYEKKTIYEDNWSTWSGWSYEPVSEESGKRKVETKTQYQGRNKKYKTIYDYWRWKEWSAWSDDKVSGEDTQTRTLYKYKIYD